MRSARRARRAVAVVLVDSSIWIGAQRLQLDLRDYLPRTEDVAVCPMIVHEVLRGARTAAQYRLLRNALMQCEMLDAPTPLARFEAAADLYLECRRAAITPSATDTLIAASAIAHGVALFADDRDFVHMAVVIPTLQLFTRS
jgi:predicted nucleic acid-binding protein